MSQEILSNDIENILLLLNFRKKTVFKYLHTVPTTIKEFQTIFFSQFENLLLNLSLKNTDHSMIFGDMNIDTLSIARKCHYIDKYELLLSSLGYPISNSEATRQTHASSSCINHFISKVHLNVTTLKTSLSNHYALVATIATFLENNQSVDIQWRNFKVLQRNKMF